MASSLSRLQLIVPQLPIITTLLNYGEIFINFSSYIYKLVVIMSQIFVFRSTITKDKDGSYKVRIPKSISSKFDPLYKKGVVVIILTELGERYGRS